MLARHLFCAVLLLSFGCTGSEQEANPPPNQVDPNDDEEPGIQENIGPNSNGLSTDAGTSAAPRDAGSRDAAPRPPALRDSGSVDLADTGTPTTMTDAGTGDSGYCACPDGGGSNHHGGWGHHDDDDDDDGDAAIDAGAGVCRCEAEQANHCWWGWGWGCDDDDDDDDDDDESDGGN